MPTHTVQCPFCLHTEWQVEYVINFDIPRNGFCYVHRIGRCGRVDRCGTSITFVSQFDIELLHDIESHIQVKLKEFQVGQWQKNVMETMQRVLIVKAGIINGMETKFLLNPHQFKKHRALRWDGKWRDPRITGQRQMKTTHFTKEEIAKEEKRTKQRAKQRMKGRPRSFTSYGPSIATESPSKSSGSNPQSPQNEQSKERERLYTEFRSAFDTEISRAVDAKPGCSGKEKEGKTAEEEREEKEEEKRTNAFYKSLKQKEKNKGIFIINKRKLEKMEQKKLDKMSKMKQFVDEDEEGMDTNMSVVDEEVRLSNVDAVNRKREGVQDAVGRNFHELSGWQSFRYGVQGKRIRRIEKRERARESQAKRIKYERKRSKKLGRQSRLDVFSITEKKGYLEKKRMARDAERAMNAYGWSGQRGQSKRTVARTWKKTPMEKTPMEKPPQRLQKAVTNAQWRRMKQAERRQKRPKVKKQPPPKISKGVRKSLDKEQLKAFVNKKESWFQGKDIEWT